MMAFLGFFSTKYIAEFMGQAEQCNFQRLFKMAIIASLENWYFTGRLEAV